MEEQGNKEIVKDIAIGGKPKKLIISAGAQAQLSNTEISVGLELHVMGDWGEDYEYDAARYDGLMGEEVQFLSVFQDEKGEYWVISKVDGSINILLPGEYKPAIPKTEAKKEGKAEKSKEES